MRIDARLIKSGAAGRDLNDPGGPAGIYFHP